MSMKKSPVRKRRCFPVFRICRSGRRRIHESAWRLCGIPIKEKCAVVKRNLLTTARLYDPRESEGSFDPSDWTAETLARFRWFACRQRGEQNLREDRSALRMTSSQIMHRAVRSASTAARSTWRRVLLARTFWRFRTVITHSSEQYLAPALPMNGDLHSEQCLTWPLMKISRLISKCGLILPSGPATIRVPASHTSPSRAISL